jgi:hypothetical protein
MRSADRLPGVAAVVNSTGFALASGSNTQSPSPALLAPGEVN